MIEADGAEVESMLASPGSDSLGDGNHFSTFSGGLNMRRGVSFLISQSNKRHIDMITTSKRELVNLGVES